MRLDPRTVQTVASRCTDWAVPTHSSCRISLEHIFIIFVTPTYFPSGFSKILRTQQSAIHLIFHPSTTAIFKSMNDAYKVPPISSFLHQHLTYSTRKVSEYEETVLFFQYSSESCLLLDTRVMLKELSGTLHSLEQTEETKEKRGKLCVRRTMTHENVFVFLLGNVDRQKV